MAALITSGAALVVAVGGGLRTELRTSSSRRDDRHRAALEAAQEAALDLRTALIEYGASLRTRTAAAPAEGGAFVMSVPEQLDTDVLEAEGRLLVARSRLADEQIVTALSGWRALARISLIDPRDGDAAGERRAFDELNDLIGAALRP